MIGSRGTQTKFVFHIVESLCAKFGAFFQSVTIFSLNHLTMGHVNPNIGELLGHVNPNIGELLGHINPNIGELLGRINLNI